MLDACRGKAAARAVGRNVVRRNANCGLLLLLLVWLVSLTSFKNINNNNKKVRPGAVALCTPSLQRSGAISRLRRERIVVARQAAVAAAVASPAARRGGRRTASKLPQQGATLAVRCADVPLATAAAATEQGLPSDAHAATFPRMALLIDGDQVGKNDFTPILDSLLQCGQFVDRRAYLSEHLARTLEEDLTRHQIRPVIVRRHVGGTKSPVDMEIAMDVLELCEQAQGDKIAGVAIASNDLDFFEVLERAQSQGMKVWLCMRAHSRTQSGISPLAQRAAADVGVEIIVYGQMSKEIPKMVPLISIHDGIAKVHGIRPVHDDLRSFPDLESLSLSLMQYGYLAANQVAMATLVSATVKFFHVNKLGPLIIDPHTIGFHQCLAAFQKNASSTWLTNPGNLIYVHPRGRSTFISGKIIAQGPFIVQDSTQLVSEILDRLGYSSPELNLQETIDMFWDGNIGHLKRRGVSVATVEGAQKLEALEREFRLDLPQYWHPPRSDVNLRDFLLGKGFLNRKDALREQVKLAIKKFLQSRGQSVPPKRSYLQLVADAHNVVSKDDPSRRI
ncbi:unnamed protein product [Polarella glacialis]|uniref:NYN domain-containing protein n=1 Tax=Polarella glacialis TaxID=89957 RepID=A0A813LBR5_POLGL|nr:unnamed protein product [Polarella glacialis]CAE8719888.1 unnamed protein product [Polarella glacialis]